MRTSRSFSFKCLNDSLTFIIADVRVPGIQVDVVLSALTFTSLQPALCAHS